MKRAQLNCGKCSGRSIALIYSRQAVPLHEEQHRIERQRQREDAKQRTIVIGSDGCIACADGIVVPSGAYELTKRFRHDETAEVRVKRKWTKNFLDIDQGTVLGHRPCEWLLLIVFLVIFYTLVGMFFVLFVYLFLLTLSEERPRYVNEFPGLSFVPHNGTIISFYEDIVRDVDPYADAIDAFLDEYGIDGQERFKECLKDDAYGFLTRQPCIFLKLNRVYGFRAETYDDVKELPRNVPDELFDHIMNLRQNERTQRIWVTCQSPDADIETKIIYVPVRYFHADEIYEDKHQPLTFDKLTVQASFKSAKQFKRIIGVKIQDVPINAAFTVQCKIWAKNIVIDLSEPGRGFVEFRMEVKSLRLKDLLLD